MPFALFHEYFPEIAELETRSMIIFSDQELPEDTYTLVESYCDESDCDCRRVFLSVMSQKRQKIMAVIAYGWEKTKFYAKWVGGNDPKAIKELKGPILNHMSSQSQLAPLILEKVEELVLSDKNYVARLKRHYKIFKQKVKSKEQAKVAWEEERVKKIGRNAPCPCGSGKKYKKCCGK